MFGDGTGFMGTHGLWCLTGADNSPATGDAYKGVYDSIAWTGTPLLAKFFFQLVFAGTAATIVSGAVAERIKFGSFVIFSFVLVAVLYPITGHWIWGGGWLGGARSRSLTSPVRRSFIQWAAGPRWRVCWCSDRGWASSAKDGKVHPIPGHNLSIATLGVFILWLGWFGFNPGSTMGVGRRLGDRARVRDDQHRRGRRDHHLNAHRLDYAEEARPDDDSQRLSRRPGGDHRALRVCDGQRLDHHRRHSPACSWCSR